jgi:YHS domain-containing protein
MKRLARSLALAITILAVPMLVAAAPPELNLDAQGVAIHGYDPVAYFTDGKPVKGSARFSHKVGDATYHFASAGHRDRFAKDPAKYAPQFGGYCAMGTAMGKKLDVDPLAWRIVDGKLYLNLNKDVQKKWLSDVPGHLKQAEAKWAEIMSIPAADLD